MYPRPQSSSRTTLLTRQLPCLLFSSKLIFLLLSLVYLAVDLQLTVFEQRLGERYSQTRYQRAITYLDCYERYSSVYYCLDSTYLLEDG
jgi:hypothetical protein